MSESWWIVITPPREQLLDALASVAESLLGLGWRIENLIHDAGAKDLARIQEPTTKDLVRVRSGNAVLRKNGRGMDLDFDFQFPGSIALGADITFFREIEPVKEMKGIFGRMRLPDDTRIRGDVEGVMASDRPSWFWWISQLDPSKWNELSTKLPEVVNRELIRIGESHVVMMWDSPYGRADELARLARILGESRPWPRRVPKKLRRAPPSR